MRLAYALGTLASLAGLVLAQGSCSKGASGRKKPTTKTPVMTTPTPASTLPSLPRLRFRRENGALVIRWEAAPHVSSYGLCFSTSKPVEPTSACLENVTSPFRHAGLTNGTRYFYRLEEVSASGVRLSDEVDVIVDEEPQLLHANPSLFGVTHGNGRYVAVGAMGLVFTSVDGVSFERIDWLEAGVNLNDVVFADGKFLAVGDEGIVALSRDGIHWSDFDSGLGVDLLRVRSVDGKLVAFDKEGQVFLSKNGISWSAMPELLGVPLADVASFGGQVLFGGGAGLLVKGTWGGTWLQRELGTPFPIQVLLHAAGKFLASGPALPRIHTSADGGAWTAGPALSFRRLVHDGRRYWGANDQLRSSSDATTWTVHGERDDDNALTSIAFDGKGGVVAVGQEGRLLASPDGWIDRWVSHTRQIQDMVLEEGKYFIAGTPRIGWSSNLVDWTFTNVAGADREEEIHDLQVGADAMVAVGNRAFYRATRSGSFEDWVKIPGIALPGPVLSVAYGNGRFVAGGLGGSLWVSSDGGATWSQVPGLDTSLVFRKTTFHEGHFAAMTNHGQVWVSADGTAWAARDVAPGETFCTQFSRGGELFVLSCTGNVYRTLNLETWELWGRMPATWPVSRSVEFDGENFVIVGSAGIVVTTSDFRSFIRRGVYVPFNLRAVVWDSARARLVLSGEAGYVGTRSKY